MELDPEVSPEEIMSREVELDPQVSPEEIMSREVELDPQVSPEEIMSREVELSPEEIKRREVELGPQVSPEEIKRREVELDPQVSPGEIKSREAELESHSWMDSDTVFWALFRTAVERASCGVHKLLGTGGVPASLASLFWRRSTVSPGFFGRYLRSNLHSLALFPPCPRP